MRRIRSLLAWLALSAVAFNALWPTLAFALPQRAGVPQIICTSMGAQLVDGNGVPVKDVPGSKSHCPLCSGPLDHALASAPALVSFPVTEAAGACGQPASRCAEGRASCATPPSQAPPAIS